MPSFQTGREAYDGTSSVRRPGALSLDYLTAWSIGPTALSDTTQGLLHRVWKVRVDNADGKVYLQRAREPIGTEPDGWEPEFELFSFTITEIEEVDLAFDQNGAPVVSAQRQGNQLWLYWFSPLAGGYVFEMLGEGRTPRLLLDDPQSLSDATILLFYVNDAVGLPQWRTQEELYATPHNMPLDRWVDVESGERAAIARSTDLFIEEVAKAVDYRLHVFASLRGGAGGYRLVSIETVPYPYRPLTELRVAGDLESTDTVEYVIPQDHSALLSIGGTLPEARVVGLVLRIETEVNASDPAWVGLIDPEHVQVNSGRLIGAGAVDLVVPYAAYDNEALRPRGVLNEVSAPVTVIVAPPQYIDSVSPAGLFEKHINRNCAMKRIWIPEAPFIHRRRMIEGELFAPKARIQGIITLGLVHVRTGLIARSLTFKNLITDAGLDGIGTKTIAAMTNFCGVGTGNSSPAVGQTSLDEQVVRSNNAGGFTEGRGVAGDLSYTWWKRTRIFTTSQANATLTEVGFFESSSGGVMFARQLIKDELGNPTTITKTPEYELRVTYEVRWYVPPDTEYSALIDGVSQTIRTRAAIVQNWGGVVPTNWAPDGGVGNLQYGSVYQGSLGPVTGVPPGAAVLSDPAWEVLDPYVGGSFERTANFRIASAVGNGTYYKTIVFARNGNMAFQHEILTGPGIIKNNTQRFDIYGQVSWTRYTP